MAYVKPVSKRAPRKSPALSATDGNNPLQTSHIVTAPPPVVTHVRSPTPDEIIDNLRFMFAVGIECSNPTIEGGVRVDELEATGPLRALEDRPAVGARSGTALSCVMGRRFIAFSPAPDSITGKFSIR